ncbi:MAG TPA: hypothetical protein PLV54_07020, partial [Anaerostipes hadrus]|nr:hypothetical protein [Anaerostipes hadrus]
MIFASIQEKKVTLPDG